MIPMIGYDVSYGRMAFRTKIDDKGISIRSLELLLERAIKSVQEQSDGRWIISNKAVVMSSDITKPVELTVIVRAGSDQYEQYLAAVKLFEDRIAVWLTDYPFDTTLRTIEEEGPKCDRDDSCERMATWVLHYEGRSDTYFCTGHAQGYVNFDTTGHATFSWEELKPATV